MWVAPEWVEAHCVVPDRRSRGTPFELYEYQLLYLAHFYLVRGDVEFDPVNPVLGPAFTFRRAMLIGPQKLGKGPLHAAHVCVEGVGPALFAGWAGKDDGYACVDHGCSCGWEYAYGLREPMGMPWATPLIQITAFSEEQTDNVYGALRPMIDHGPLHDLIPKTGEEFIRLPRGGRIDVVTASAQSRLGNPVTFVPQDELGLWTKRNKMTNVADTQWRNLAGMGGRASLTSNAWDPTEKSVAQQEYESGAKDVYRQFVQPPKSLSFENKRDRQKIYRIVYPKDVLRQNDGHIDLDSIEAEAVDLLARDLPQAARFFGNMLMAGAGAAVDPARWAVLQKRRAIREGALIGLGFDGSISEDATALIACTPDGHVFVPTYENDTGSRVPTVWERPDNADPDWRIPRLEVESAVDQVFGHYRVGRMFCDPPKWQTEIETWAGYYNVGLTLEEAIVVFFDTNQPRRMAGACDRFTTGLLGDDLTHDNNPVLTAHVLAMVKKKAYVKSEDERDGRTRWIFTKGHDGLKIDAGIGAVLAYEAAMTMTDLVLEPFAFRG